MPDAIEALPPSEVQTPRAGAGRQPPGRPVYASAPLSGRDFALLVVQLALLSILVWQFHLEEKRRLLLAMLAVLGGFVVNTRLPPALRRGWFAAISVGCLLVILGFHDGFLALSVAATLIAVTRLPVSIGLRSLVLIALGAGCIWLRWQSKSVFWPIVGSMFMFRTISYMQALRRERIRPSLVETASHFLMLPNVFFPLFPVVDAKVFRDTWYNDDRRTIYQTGVHWMAVGVLHLFLYRVIKYELLPTPLEVRTLSDVALYLVMNYGLYIRVSGQFHLICGMLHLFGWNLPRTHDHYFLASSFSDIWRRINIYWKDFLMKTFFYPAYFWLRSRRAGRPQNRVAVESMAVTLAVIWVFFWTWLAHSWQTFWLLGSFPFHGIDGVMWLAVGGLVAVNAVLDYRRVLRPRQKDVSVSWGAAAIHSLKIMAVFVLVSVFWARWTNVETFRYVAYITISKIPSLADVTPLAAWSAAVFAALTVGQRLFSRRGQTASAMSDLARLRLDRLASVNIGVLGAAVLLAVSGGPADYLGTVGARIKRLQTDRLTSGEAMAVVDGYYEQLATANSQASPLIANFDGEPKSQGDLFSSMLRPRNDLLGFELIPGWRGEFSKSPLTINRWGMRDVDRTLEKPDGVVRIALVGSSVVMGYGVKDDETMTQRLETLLNAESKGVRYEVLNFGSGRYSPVHRRLLLEKKILAFEPDLIVYVAHQDELRAVGVIAGAVIDGRPLDDECLSNCVRNVAIKPGDSEGVIVTKLNVETFTILRCTYDRLVRTCREQKLGLEYVYLPIPSDYEFPLDPKIVIDIAKDAGMPVHDLSGWWDASAPGDVIVPDTQHPTASGQARIAERLFQVLGPVLKRFSPPVVTRNVP